MKQAMKRFGAMLLTMAMLLSLAVTGVSAEGGVSTTTLSAATGVSIKFNELGSTEGSSDVVKAYRVLKYNSTGNDFEDGEVKAGETGFSSYLNTKNNAAGENKKADGLAYLTSMESDSTQLRDLLKGFLAEGGLTGTHTNSTNGVLSDVEPGYYILKVESTTKIYDPMLLFVGYEDGELVVQMGGNDLTEENGSYTATVKSTKAPEVKKFVFDDRSVTGETDRNTAMKAVGNWKSAAASEVGQKVDFGIKVTLPTYPDSADVTLTLNDTLTNLKYTGGNYTDTATDFTGVKVYYKNGDSYMPVSDAITKVTAGDYTPAGIQTLTIELDYAKLKAISNQNEFYVYYQATLTEDAVKNGEGEDAAASHNGTNDVTLSYTVKTSAGDYTGNSKADTVNVYTYNFKLDKTYTKNTNLTGAAFSVYMTDPTGDNVQAVKFTKATAGDYYYPDALGTVTEIPADFEIRGLDVNTKYYVKEVKTAPGYYLPTSYFTLELSGEETASTTALNGDLKYENENDYSQPSSFVAAKQEADQALVQNGTESGDNNYKYGEISDPEKYQYYVKLNNTNTPVLPSTGGMGTTLFTIGGVALLALAAAMLILRRRKN